MSLKGLKPIISGFDRQCVGGAKNLRTNSILPKKLFGPSFYHEMRPLSLFFGLHLVTRNTSYPGHDTVQLLSYHLQSKSGRYLASSRPQLPHKNRIPIKTHGDDIAYKLNTNRLSKNRLSDCQNQYQGKFALKNATQKFSSKPCELAL